VKIIGNTLANTGKIGNYNNGLTYQTFIFNKTNYSLKS